VDSRRLRSVLAALIAAGAAAAGIAVSSGDGDEAPAPSMTAPAAGAQASGGQYVLSSDEAAAVERTLAAIEAGGPLPYEEDGGVFQNREGLLPDRPLGYYREYTVETPGSPDRGARRLVIGDDGETFYTADHYASFHELGPEELE
jgi:ribonuclease T1